MYVNYQESDLTYFKFYKSLINHDKTKIMKNNWLLKRIFPGFSVFFARRTKLQGISNGREFEISSPTGHLPRFLSLLYSNPISLLQYYLGFLGSKIEGKQGVDVLEWEKEYRIFWFHTMRK